MEEIAEYVPLLGFQRYRPYFDDTPAPTVKAKSTEPTVTEIDTKGQIISLR